MNKLISKIVGVALGLSLAVGTGVAIGVNGKSTIKADAASATWELVTSAPTDWSGEYILCNGTSGTVKYLQGSTFSSSSASGVDVAVSNNKITVDDSNALTIAKSETSGKYTIMINGKYVGRNANSNGMDASATWSTNYDNSISYSSGKVTIAGNGGRTLTWYNNNSNFRYYAASNNNSQLYRKAGAVTSPTITVDNSFAGKIGSNTLEVSYSNFTANSTINAVSDNESVATVTSSVTVPSTSGKVNFTITGVAEGTANITLSATGATSQTVAVAIADIKEFTKISKAGQVVSGGHYLIARTGTDTVMSTTQNSNNRGITTATGSSPFDTLESKAGVAVLTISAGTGDYAGYYTIQDPANSGYLYAVSGNNYLRTGSTISGNYYYWAITFSGGNAVLTNKGNSYTIRYNSSSSIFSSYSNGQIAVDLYLQTSELPSDTPLTSISAENASVQAGSTITFTGSYLPVNATEVIEAVLTDDTLATLGEVSMANGTFSVSITGSEVGSTTLSFAGADGHGSATVTLTVTGYTATHTKVTSTSGLYNGMKVILGNSEEGLVGAPHMGGNNLPVVAGSFSEDGSTLSNSAASAQEFTLWYLTIADKDENDVSGWAFYANGRYLTSVTGGNNHWKQAYKLSSLCLFTISISTDGASIVCADSNVERNTILLNKGSSCISAYASTQTYPLIDLYVKESSSDAAIAGGYEDFCLLMDYISTSSQGSGYCITDDYYLHAKSEYNNTLTNAQKSLLSADAVARLQAWAVANGDVLTTNPGTIQAQASRGLLINSNNNSVLVIVIVTAFVTMTFVGGYFLLRKKKEN